MKRFQMNFKTWINQILLFSLYRQWWQLDSKTIQQERKKKVGNKGNTHLFWWGHNIRRIEYKNIHWSLEPSYQWGQEVTVHHLNMTWILFCSPLSTKCSIGIPVCCTVWCGFKMKRTEERYQIFQLSF